MNKLQNKIALITGGTTGIGAATAKLFQAEGATVVVTGSNPVTLEAAREELPGIEVMASDAGDVAATQSLIEAVKDKHGRIDVLFVNAGIAGFAPIEATDEATFDRQFSINVKGAYFVMKHAAPVLSDGASIILTASMAGARGMPGTTVYSATKAALRSFGRTFAGELAPRRIRVNTISPGPIDTPILGKGGDASPAEIKAMMDGIIAQVPLGRIGQAKEVAAAALYFPSDDSKFTTGTELFVDGGATEL